MTVRVLKHPVMTVQVLKHPVMTGPTTAEPVMAVRATTVLAMTGPGIAAAAGRRCEAKSA